MFWWTFSLFTVTLLIYPPDPVQMELDADLDSNPAYKVCGFETTVIKNYFKFFFSSCYTELIKRKLITVILVLYYSLYCRRYDENFNVFFMFCSRLKERFFLPCSIFIHLFRKDYNLFVLHVLRKDPARCGGPDGRLSGQPHNRLAVTHFTKFWRSKSMELCIFEYDPELLF